MTKRSLSPFVKSAGGFLTIFAALTAFTPATATAASISGGALTMNLDRDALAASFNLDLDPNTPSMYLEEYFTAQDAAVRTYTQLLNDDLVPGTGEVPATNLQFEVNGPTVTNLTGRNNQPTTLTFNPNDLEGSVTGAVGLGGATRYRVDYTAPYNRVLVSDMSLEYDAANVDASIGRSGWTLYNNGSYRLDVYNLFNVVTDLSGGSLRLSGDLGVTASMAAMLNGTTNATVGDFGFQTAVVPVPAAVWLFFSGLAGLGLFGRNRKNAA